MCDNTVVDERYLSVRSFNDLLQINVEFLENKLPCTYYYGGPFGDCDDHTPRRNYLIDLHTKYSVYTINGQSNVSDPTFIQHSYLNFIVKQDVSAKIQRKLFNHPEIYTYAYIPNKIKSVISDNFPEEKFSLTRYIEDNKWISPTNWHRDIDWYNELDTPYLNVDKVLHDCSYYMIVVKDPASGRESDEILREILDQ